MAKIDEIKEHIGALRGYLNIVIAIILALGAGISKLYLSLQINILFWIGIALTILLLIVFAIIARVMHNNIKKLKDL
ncbi:hypothetical protein JHD48_10210 [Sulfurimonas sp. SAG-AH-194-I05]|nr:hypothetical protein [Sulfurimonas sp. SAG-AH-194-I05]MDF1876106.1 hypothetical protein [Sulfurimonas sp. SAG-AH-194-I05]